MKLTQDEISDLIGNRRYCFVIMPFRSGRAFFNHLRKVLEEKCGLRCIRADEIPSAGELLLPKVHQLIDNSELVIADLSKMRANLYYEVGYAKAKGKRTLVICKKGIRLAVDLHGLEKLEYEDTDDGLMSFDNELVNHVTALLGSERSMLRQMLIGPRSYPSYLLASPRWHTARTITEKTRERRTYGDNLGVVGIISAFGSLLGQEGVPELISAQHPHMSVLEKDCNLYLIGSPRANKLTKMALEMVQEKCAKGWRFKGRVSSKRSCLYMGKQFKHEADHSQSVPEYDYGIIIRGPHPLHEGRMIMVLAGTRSLGTGAACLAATRVELIQQICDRMAPLPLNHQNDVVWALVKAKPDPKDNHASMKYITVEDVGIVQ